MSPDASWVPTSVLTSFGKKALDTVTGVVIAPLFVVEVRSPSDRRKDQERKCERWIKSGVGEAWLVDPIERKVNIFCPGCKTEVLVAPKQVKSVVLEGFVLKCKPIWED